MAKNLLHCETGFGVYRSTQLGHIPFFLLLYLLVLGWPKYSVSASVRKKWGYERKLLTVVSGVVYSVF
jgi:hypothetical protein